MDGPKEDLIRSCLNCSKQFTPLRKEVNRGGGKFCSRNCSFEVARGVTKKKRAAKAIAVVCAYCGIGFTRMPSDIPLSKSGLYFCCRDHKDKAQRTGGIKEIQPSHYRNGFSEYRAIALRNLPNSCNRCGFSHYPEILVVHHKDRNRFNAQLENLEILCPNCHAIEHYASSASSSTLQEVVLL